MNDQLSHERFMRLFLEHEPELLRTAMIYLPFRSDARDIVQETAVALLRDFERFDESRPFVPWACGYVRIEVRRFLREARKGTLLSERAADILAVAESRVTAESEARKDAMNCCLEQLPEQQRDLIRGYYLEERSVDSLASQQSRTVEAVYKALQRIRGGLLACIEGRLAKA